MNAAGLPGLWIIEPTLFYDNRGTFTETFRREAVHASIGYDLVVAQQTRTVSLRSVLRGLLYQSDQPQGRLISVARGAVMDVQVDVRKGSPTFGRWMTFELSRDNRLQILAAPGFAHGYVVLSDQAEMVVSFDQPFSPGSQRGIAWNDPQLGIPWPITKPILSPLHSEFPNLHAIPDSDLPNYDDSLFRLGVPRLSCFISHASEDLAAVRKLYDDLKRRGVICFFAPDSMVIGGNIRDSIEQAVQEHDRLLLVLSRNSIRSRWVEDEVEAAFEKERKLRRRIIVPIALDQSVFRSSRSWVATIRRTRHIGDFMTPELYEASLAKLLQALTSD
jgi:dTDP-4-dehydrorhamnose 3,5-epimerase